MTESEVTEEEIQRYEKLKRKWKRLIRRFWSEMAFTWDEYITAFSKLKAKTGLGMISKKYFPEKTMNRSKILNAINFTVLSSESLPMSMLKSKSNLIPKNSAGDTRPLSISTRLACLVDKMVSERLASCIKLLPEHFKIAHGFLSNRNVDEIIGELIHDYQMARNNKQFSALVSIDQKGAYNTVSHIKACLKVFDLIEWAVSKLEGKLKRSKALFFSVIWGYIIRWFGEGKRVCYLKRKGGRPDSVIIRRGLPQGSCLSCLVYLVFFDFRVDNYTPDLVAYIFSYFFADDSSFLLTAPTKKMLDDRIGKLVDAFRLWCTQSGQVMAMQKCTILYFHQRRKESKVHGIEVVRAVRLLGIIFDSQMSFCNHVAHVKTWFTRRWWVLRVIRRVLDLDDFWILRLSKCLLNKIFFGTYWVAMLSENQSKVLTTIYENTLKISLGISIRAESRRMLDLISEPSLVDKAAYFMTLRFYESRFTIRRRVHIFDLAKPVNSRADTSGRRIRESTRSQTMASRMTNFKWDWWFDKCRNWLDEILDSFGICWCFDNNKVATVDMVRCAVKDMFWPMKLHPETTFVRVAEELNKTVRERKK